MLHMTKKNTKDGEPYCYFMLAKIKVFDEVGTAKLYIVKNPKVFPESTFADFNKAKYEATAEYLKCSE